MCVEMPNMQLSEVHTGETAATTVETGATRYDRRSTTDAVTGNQADATEADHVAQQPTPVQDRYTG